MFANGNNRNIPDPSNTPSDTQTVLKPNPNPFANPGVPAGFLNQDPNSLSFILNQDTGNLEIGKSPIAEQQGSKTPEPVQEPPKTPDPNEERFLRLEQGIATIASFLEGQKAASLNNLNGQQNQQPQQTQQPEEFDYSGVDTSDPNNIRDIIRNEFKVLFSTEIKPLIGKQAELGVRASFNDAAARFGKDFLEGTLPTIDHLIKSGVLKSDPNMDFVNIHLQLKQAGLTKPVTANTDSTIQPSNGSTPSGQPQTAQELVQKANALSTETPGAQRTIMANTNPKKGTKSYTVDDAVNDAFDQIFGGR
jgi:hypothetical protein